MKIACLTTSYPRFDGDLAGTFVEELNVELVARGHEIEVFAPGSTEPRCPTRKNIRVNEVQYLPRPMQRTFYDAGFIDNVTGSHRAKLGALTFPPKLALDMLRARRRFDAVISHWALPNALVGALVSRGKPHVAIFHSTDVHLLVKLNLARTIASMLLRTNARPVFVARVLREKFLNALDRKISSELEARSTILAMGVTSSFKRDDREEARRILGLTRFTIVTLGRLVPIKGLDVLLDAIETMDIDLVVLGDGPERGRLETSAAKKGIRARFVGTVHGEAKHAWLAAADLFVMPSRASSELSEGLPVALLEAMDAGLSIVATQSGGIEETIRDAGLVVRVNDPWSLRDAIGTMMKDDSLRKACARRAREYARPYAWSSIAPKFEALLTSRD